MMQRQGHLPTTEASRYLQRLCYHFTRKIRVTYDAHHGEAHFPWGLCVLRADTEALRFDCSAEDDASLARVQFAIDSHVELFSRKSPMAVCWQPAQTGPGAGVAPET
ncbi:hypothetical protein ASE52_18650 [Acidovorax sp. Root275]|uniref:DUF2218 domain-containing protein n=1 Tax=Acidovorax sp. Root275 TaxID=1736508 RepID=UPI00070E95F1|nr:DUF2218 domain-containing protein [Acidovorax sp. Root275]KRD46650.1 hypothetical protein ASE52_18650 [Acidovorax sp. Root275]